MRNRTWTDEQFIDAVRTSFSIAEVLRKIGLEDTNAGSNYYTVKNAITRLGLDVSHFTGRGHAKGKLGISSHPVYSLEEILVENSPYSTSATSGLKRRLLREGVIHNKCYICGMLPKWNCKLLVMVLDHINGIKSDNRKENLRLLCPNCNSQTNTFTGKNARINRFRRKPRCCSVCSGVVSNASKTGMCCRCAPKFRKDLKLIKMENFCSKCGKKITNKGKSGLCVLCVRIGQRRVVRPPLDVLLQEVDELGYLVTGRKYGVSDNAIRKWIRFYKKI